jgi:hypothetical protein
MSFYSEFSNLHFLQLNNKDEWLNPFFAGISSPTGKPVGFGLVFPPTGKPVGYCDKF